jgi:DnaJ-class molecular chaperone
MDHTIDYYGVLGVLPSAEIEVIKAAYRALAKKYHPDAGNYSKMEAEAKFRKLNDAFEVLTTPELRSRYDSMRTTDRTREFYADGQNRPSGDDTNYRWTAANAGPSHHPTPRPEKATLGQVGAAFGYTLLITLGAVIGSLALLVIVLR